MFNHAKRLLASLAGATVLLTPAAVLASTAVPAEASSAPLGVTLQAGHGGSATFNPYGDPVLTLGSDTSTSAQVNITGVAHTQAPSEAPRFTTDNYAAGSPRWVINFANGYWLLGYPSQSGMSNGWDANGPGGYYKYNVTYSQGLADVGASHTHVSSAYIIADSDQTAGVSDTLTQVQYDGQYLASPHAGTVHNYNGYSSECLNASGGKVTLSGCGSAASGHWVFQPVENTSWGTQVGYLVNTGSGRCANDAAYGGPGAHVIESACGPGGNEMWQYWPQYQEYSLYSGKSTVCLNDPGYSTTSGTQQIVWTCLDTTNEQYTLPS